MKRYGLRVLKKEGQAITLHDTLENSLGVGGGEERARMDREKKANSLRRIKQASEKG